MTQTESVDPGLGVLVVDDDRAIAELLAQALAGMGLRVLTAFDGAAAREILASDPAIAVLLSDIRMPGTSGLDLAESVLGLRSDFTALEVVLVTGDATADLAIEALRARVFDMVTKPFRIGQVADVVNRALGVARARRGRARREAVLRSRMRSAEAERARLSARLAQSSSQLADTAGQLAEIERSRRDLFAVISHELRTPLIPIIGFSEIIVRTPDLGRDELRDYAEMILQGGNALLGLIDRALDVLALERGEGLAPPAPVRIVRLAEAARATQARLAGDRGVTVDLIGPPDAEISADARRIEEAIQHLLDNAIRASGEGARVAVAWSASPAGAAEIIVRDAGVGIAPAVIERLGTPFLQGDLSLSRAWPGAGLGLALVWRIAQAHGGDLRLCLRPGGGTEATMTLPGARHGPA